MITICIRCFMTGGPSEEHRNNKPKQGKNSGEVKRRHHVSYQPPRILLTGMRAPPERTLSQNDWPETTWKLILSPQTRDCESRGRAVLLGSLTLLVPSPVKSLSLSVGVSPQTIHFRVLDRSPLGGPGRDPASQNRTMAAYLRTKKSVQLEQSKQGGECKRCGRGTSKSQSCRIF